MGLRCAICGVENSEGVLFCSGCTAPVGVVGLGELTDADRERCMGALWEVLAGAGRGGGAGQDADDGGELFAAYLSAVWLRPETALIQYAEARGMQRLRERGVVSGMTDLDLGCGDGVHAAIMAGWRFGVGFDVFQSLDLGAKDLFDRYEPSEYAVEIARKGQTVADGLDIRASAVGRAGAIGVFGTVHKASATAMPIDAGSVSVAFSNMLRDLPGEVLAGALAEVRRVLTPGGAVAVSAMTPAYRDALYFEPAARAAAARGDEAEARALLKLDRGRSVFCRQQLTIEQWRETFARAGLELVADEPIVGPGAIRFWDVGLRPFAVPLIAQATMWRKAGVLGTVKPGLLAAMARLLEPVRRNVAAGEPCMRLLVARKG